MPRAIDITEPRWFELGAARVRVTGQSPEIVRPAGGTRAAPPFARGIRMALLSLRLIPHVFFLLRGRKAGLVRSDILRWSEICHGTAPASPWELYIAFLEFMTFNPEFRNVFYIRIGRLSWLFSWLCRGLNSFRIDAASIGPGLFVQHGEHTFISALSIGANFWVGRHVVVGFSNGTDRPLIGDNVRMFAGAKVVGDIVVGDGSTIGLNTVVTTNVPPGVTLLGVPGRIIWKAAP